MNKTISSLSIVIICGFLTVLFSSCEESENLVGNARLIFVANEEPRLDIYSNDAIIYEYIWQAPALFENIQATVVNGTINGMNQYEFIIKDLNPGNYIWFNRVNNDTGMFQISTGQTREFEIE